MARRKVWVGFWVWTIVWVGGSQRDPEVGDGLTVSARIEVARQVAPRRSILLHGLLFQRPSALESRLGHAQPRWGVSGNVVAVGVGADDLVGWAGDNPWTGAWPHRGPWTITERRVGDNAHHLGR